MLSRASREVVRRSVLAVLVEVGERTSVVAMSATVAVQRTVARDRHAIGANLSHRAVPANSARPVVVVLLDRPTANFVGSEGAMRARRAIPPMTSRNAGRGDTSSRVRIIVSHSTSRLPIDRVHPVFEVLRGSELPFPDTGEDEEDETDGACESDEDDDGLSGNANPRGSGVGRRTCGDRG